jgi:selenide,water dikinase
MSTSDDAGVYLFRDDLALVQTVDFFAPMVDDPGDFGRIAATNALSDIWAMGGVPRTALNLLGFPFDDLPPEVAGDIMAGALEVCREHGVVVLGGHTTDEDVPRFGMAVTGVVDPDAIWRNVGARPGDVLVLTKPLGSGLLTGARMRDLIDDADLEEPMRWMKTANRLAAEALSGLAVRAVTDVTGYGLLGHLREMLRGEDRDVTVAWDRVPVMTLVPAVLDQWVGTGGGRRNLAVVGEQLEIDVPDADRAAAVLADPQTSGGLLVALEPEQAETYLARLAAVGAMGWVIARVDHGSGRIRVTGAT